jgi:hypothetical protein
VSPFDVLVNGCVTRPDTCAALAREGEQQRRPFVKYALLIYTSETEDSGASSEEQQAVMAAYNAFGQQFKDKIVGGEALLPTTSATTVRVREGKSLTTDGPFAETKEQLGGFYLIEASNLDEAITIAAHIPGAARGEIEVRPVMVFN